MLSELWSADGIACGGGSSAGYNANYQWIRESGTALRFFLSEELSPFHHFVLQEGIESAMNQKGLGRVERFL